MTTRKTLIALGLFVVAGFLAVILIDGGASIAAMVVGGVVGASGSALA